MAIASCIGSAAHAASVPNENEIFESPPFFPKTAQPIQSNVVDIAIIDRNTGRALKKYNYRGQLYVAGVPGSKYSIRVTNTAPGRLLTVVSVDGVNVVNGKKAAVGDVGYVLSAFGNTDINGWRKSDNVVAAFEFTALSNSYAARTGRPDNVGIIGVAAFTEKVVIPEVVADSSYNSAASERAAAGPSAPSAPAAKMKAEALGTRHGERERSHVDHTTFERSSTNPNRVITIRYDSYENLVEAGVIPRARSAQPEAFPGSNQYVPDPR